MPDPTVFSILDFKQVGHLLLVKVRYPQATNYEGVKILLYRNTTIQELIAQGARCGIDPHFSESKDFKSPFARFEPTELGWDAACALLESSIVPLLCHERSYR